MISCYYLGMEIIRIPTEREGVLLKTATELDDKYAVHAARNFYHPLKPDQVGAPDHHAYQALRTIRREADPNELMMGIWDTKGFQNIAFIGFVSLKPYPKLENAAEVGCEINRDYRHRGYATIAVRGIMKYGRENLGYEDIVARIISKNTAFVNLFEGLGFRLDHEQRGASYYVSSPDIYKPEAIAV